MKTPLHYVSAGRGKLILFLHGFPEFSCAWQKQFDEFSKDYFVVAPDLRGYHLSEKPESIEHYQMPYLIADIHALMTQLGYEKCILVGHDWGGMISWCFAATYSTFVEKLIVINAPHPALLQKKLLTDPAQQKAGSYLQLFRDPRAEKILSANHYDYLWNHFLSEIIEKKLFSAKDIERYEAMWANSGLTGPLNYYRAWSLDFDFTKFVVSVPTLVIWGEKDRALLPCLLDALDCYATDLTIKKIPDASHWVVHEKPEWVNQLIRDFL